MPTTKLKLCPRCWRRKSTTTDFHKCAGMKDGFQGWCRTCAAVYNRERYLADLANNRVATRLDKANPHRRASYLWKSAKARAIQHGLVFELTREWIAQKLVAGICEVTGLPFDLIGSPDIDARCRWPWSPSLDRINNKRGYTTDNVRLVVWIYNLAKNRWDDETVLRLAKALCKRRR